MKNLCIYFLIVIILVSCVTKMPGGFRCSPDGQVCVDILASQPIHYGDPVDVIVSVSSERDIDKLYISLGFTPNIIIEGVENWNENIQDPLIWLGGAGWRTAISANQTLDFTRTFTFPLEEGYFTIIASISEENSFRVSNMLTIAMTTQGGTVYLANTPIPDTPGYLPTIEPHVLETLLAMPTNTPWSTLTPRPVVNNTPTPPAYPPPTVPGDWPATPYP